MQSVGEVLQNHPILQGENGKNPLSVSAFENQTPTAPQETPEEKKIRIARENGKKGGRPKGSGNPQSHSTLKREATKRYIARASKAADRLLDTQLGLAFGVQLLYKIETVVEGETTLANGKKNVKTKRRLRQVEDPREIRAYICHENDIEDDEEGYSDFDPENYYFITAKKPDREAIKDIFERAFGKPTEKHEVEAVGSLGELVKKSLGRYGWQQGIDQDGEYVEIEESEEISHETTVYNAPEALPKTEADTSIIEKAPENPPIQEVSIVVPETKALTVSNENIAEIVGAVASTPSRKDMLKQINNG